MPRIRLALVALFALATSAHAASPLARRADAYLQDYGFRARTVAVNLPGRNVTRTFVPVTDATRPDFIARMSGPEAGAIILHHGDDLEHGIVHLAAGKGTLHTVIHNPPGPARFVADIITPAYWLRGQQRYITLELGAPQLAALEQHWMNTQQQPGAKSGCMWWLVHAEVAGGQSLSHFLGVKRAAASSNLIKKLVHAGNERVGLIGFHVPDLQAFDRLTDVELMGVPPGGGALDAMKE